MALELGFLSPLYNLIRDTGGWLYDKFGPKDPAKVLKHRTKWKAEFERQIELMKNHNLIIRDLVRMDSYPDIDGKAKGISPWFKTEFKGLYHRGFEVFLRIESIKYHDKASKSLRVRSTHFTNIGA